MHREQKRKLGRRRAIWFWYFALSIVEHEELVMKPNRREFLVRSTIAGIFGRAILSGCAASLSIAAQAEPAPRSDAQTVGKMDRPLIVYFSRTQNTAAVARMIGQQTGGDLVALETQTAYPSDYRATVEQVQREYETGYLPPLKPLEVDVAAYRTIFVGFPNWGMRLPPPMQSFLSHNDLRGKTVIPFLTHGGWFTGSGLRDVRRLCAGCQVLDGLSLQGGLERDGILFVMEGGRARQVERQVSRWLDGLQLPAQ